MFSRLDYNIAVPSSLVSLGFGWKSWRGSTGVWCDLLASSRSLTTYPNICGMCCTGFHFHSASHTGSRPWCGGVCLAGRPPIWASSCVGCRSLRSSVHGNLVAPFARSATMQTPSFSVVGPTTWNGLPIDLKHLPKRWLFSIPPPSQDYYFPLGLGRERLWVGILKGCYINFDWLIDNGRG